MTIRELVIEALECIISSGNAGMRDNCATCIYPGGGDCLVSALRDALALLKAQVPRVMTLEEIREYLSDHDGDKKPLWLEWSTIPALSGWVLASNVNDLMNCHIDTYNIKWRPWTFRPTDEQKKAVKWE